jgi:hypothetical protein
MMLMQTKKAVGVAFPFRETDREECRQALGRGVLPPIKAGSELQRCASCYMEVVVGPLLAATGLRVICAVCAHKVGMEGF